MKAQRPLDRCPRCDRLLDDVPPSVCGACGLALDEQSIAWRASPAPWLCVVLGLSVLAAARPAYRVLYSVTGGYSPALDELFLMAAFLLAAGWCLWALLRAPALVAVTPDRLLVRWGSDCVEVPWRRFEEVILLEGRIAMVVDRDRVGTDLGAVIRDPEAFEELRREIEAARARHAATVSSSPGSPST